MPKNFFFLLLVSACSQSQFSIPDAAPRTSDAAMDIQAPDAGAPPMDAGAAVDAPDTDAGPDTGAGPDERAPGCGPEGFCWVMGVPLHDFHGFGDESTGVFAVGAEGTIRFYDGRSWSDRSSPTRARIDSVVARSASDVWILAESELWHFDGVEWRLDRVDDGMWRGNFYGLVDRLVLDDEGRLFTADRRYSGSEYSRRRHEYVGGRWVAVDMLSVSEARPAESYDEALRRSAGDYEHAFEGAYFDEVPKEVWVNGAVAAWGNVPGNVIRARAITWNEHVWERQVPGGFMPVAFPPVEPLTGFDPQCRDFDIAGFPSGDALVVHQQRLFVVGRGDTLMAPRPSTLPKIKSVEGGVAQFYLEGEGDAAEGHVILRSPVGQTRMPPFDASLCPDGRWGQRGAPRFVDVAMAGEEIWASVMLDQSRTGTPCLLHYDGETWAARRVFDEDLRQYAGYVVDADDDGAWLFSRDEPGAYVVRVPREFMRSQAPAESLTRLSVPQAESIAILTPRSPGPRIWRGPTGLWIYGGDYALFRADAAGEGR